MSSHSGGRSGVLLAVALAAAAFGPVMAACGGDDPAAVDTDAGDDAMPSSSGTGTDTGPAPTTTTTTPMPTSTGTGPEVDSGPDANTEHDAADAAEAAVDAADGGPMEFTIFARDLILTQTSDMSLPTPTENKTFIDTPPPNVFPPAFFQ